MAIKAIQRLKRPKCTQSSRGSPTIVVNSILVPAGMPRTGTLTGIEEPQSRTGSNIGQYPAKPVNTVRSCMYFIFFNFVIRSYELVE
jgi:hypothetical protein